MDEVKLKNKVATKKNINTKEKFLMLPDIKGF